MKVGIMLGVAAGTIATYAIMSENKIEKTGYFYNDRYYLQRNAWLLWKSKHAHAKP